MSMRSEIISVYKFSRAGKVKQLRLGNRREKRSVEKYMLIPACVTFKRCQYPLHLEGTWGLTDFNLLMPMS